MLLEVEPLKSDMSLWKEKESQTSKEIDHALNRQNQKTYEEIEKINREIQLLKDSSSGEALRN